MNYLDLISKLNQECSKPAYVQILDQIRSKKQLIPEKAKRNEIFLAVWVPLNSVPFPVAALPIIAMYSIIEVTETAAKNGYVAEEEGIDSELQNYLLLAGRVVNKNKRPHKQIELDILSAEENPRKRLKRSKPGFFKSLYKKCKRWFGCYPI